ncbi:MAG TPA: SMP-30/gluconolactonase/LRE family protein [Kiloniellales bacterium]|nr:SMP-30/gluconolactonase/LRE family protein [Kiloniellales bacterium]
MRRLLVLLALFALPAHAQEPGVLDPEAYYPEGLFWDQRTGALFYAEMTRERVRRWQDGTFTDFVATESCGPTAVARAGTVFVIACHLGGHLLIVDEAGTLVERIFESSNGRNLVDPNDLSGDGTGVYVSDSGSFSPTAPATGALLYWQPGHPLRLLATGLQYANGVLADPEHGRLLVSEHLARRILSFPLRGPGEIEMPSVFADISALMQVQDPWTGPDGLDRGPDGRIYAGIYAGARVLAFDPDGKALGQFALPMTFTTSVAVAGDGRSLFACGAYDNRLAPYLGPVLQFPVTAMQPVAP